MGWYGSALTSGVALGAPVAGFLIDLTGPSGGFIAVAVVSAVIGVVGLGVGSLHTRRSAAGESATRR